MVRLCFNVLKKLQNCFFQSGYTILYPHQQCISFSVSSQYCYCLSIITIPVDVKWYLSVCLFWAIKLSLFTNDMIISVENFMESTVKLKELSCKFMKIVG